MGGEFVHEYTQILTDPAHAAAEITMTVLVEGLLLGVIWPFISPLVKRRFARAVQQVTAPMVAAEHEILDAEHGVTHERGTHTLGPATPSRTPSDADAGTEVTGQQPPPRGAFDPDDAPGGDR